MSWLSQLMKRFLPEEVTPTDRKRTPTSLMKLQREEEILLNPVLKQKNIKYPTLSEFNQTAQNWISNCKAPKQIHVAKNHLMQTILRGFQQQAYTSKEVRDFKLHLDDLILQQAQKLNPTGTLADY